MKGILSIEAKYEVSLLSGNIELVIENSTDLIPYKMCDSFMEADYFSLNILRQNSAETEFRTEKECLEINRYVLGITQTVKTKDILPMMKYIKETYPNEFV